MGPLAASLAAIAPGDLSKSFFCNSGAEAVEGALKLARISTKRTHLLYAENSFHGKSFGALSVTGRSKYQEPFRPLLPDCHAVPFGDLDALERELKARECAAFIVEPVQGEGGIITPPDGYLKAAEELCHANGALLIADEIQTGFGRTGFQFGVDHDGAMPDIMCTAKALGGGVMPLGAYTASDAVWERGYGTQDACVLHTSTFGGNTRAMAAGLKAIEILERDGLAEAARTKGATLKAGLERIAETTDLIKEVRGRGLLIGVEFYEPKVAKKLSAEYLACIYRGDAAERPRHHHRLHAEQPERHPVRAAPGSHRRADRARARGVRATRAAAATASPVRLRDWVGRCCSGAGTSQRPAAASGLRFGATRGQTR